MKPVLWMLCLVALPAIAQMYRWTDAEGNVHFTDQPPSGTDSEEITVRPPDRIGQGDSVRAIQERLDRLRKAENEQFRQEEDARLQDEAEQNERKRLCQRARTQLGIFQGAVFTTGADGGRRYLTDDEIAARRDEVSTWIDKNCKGY